MNRYLILAFVVLAYISLRVNAQLPEPQTPEEKELARWRQELKVYAFTGQDYPAMFAIFAGLIIVLVLALIYIVVGMMSMDPSRDSIIYRMTTTRMKRD
ncbi:hypothetical protein WR25_04495 [Diploscapter pachys]|uniref:Renin receptor-like C-terminal transmembrane spanning segment domain-containing protein n=1 Tax=Diploscapter pachys TaxID=2018661 RepID=A0A2A2LFP3_9BILA|nr:hypothetical protein WR25_04495 [Diploscapter pachys]